MKKTSFVFLLMVAPTLFAMKSILILLAGLAPIAMSEVSKEQDSAKLDTPEIMQEYLESYPTESDLLHKEQFEVMMKHFQDYPIQEGEFETRHVADPQGINDVLLAWIKLKLESKDHIISKYMAFKKSWDQTPEDLQKHTYTRTKNEICHDLGEDVELCEAWFSGIVQNDIKIWTLYLGKENPPTEEL